MITFSSSGNFNRTDSFLETVLKNNVSTVLNTAGAQGVEALRSATPVDSGKTAASWGYTVNSSRSGVSIVWTNSHINDGVNVVILLQYGHGTGTGGYVNGRDFINPAIQPIFDRIAEDVWKAVTSA